jgi:hypothetical protein
MKKELATTIFQTHVMEQFGREKLKKHYNRSAVRDAARRFKKLANQEEDSVSHVSARQAKS